MNRLSTASSECHQIKDDDLANGQLVAVDGGVDLLLAETPDLVGRMDGFKTESVALRESRASVEAFIGTDDENLGNVLRPLP